MKTASPITSKYNGIWLDLIVFIGLIGLAFSISPSFKGIILNYDEGINLIKSSLVREGFSLYTDIWSDQGPVFTWILALVLTFDFDPVVTGRALVNVFAIILVSSVYLSSLAFSGRLAAISAAFFLVLSTRFLLLANAVMIGLPSIALCSAGLTCLIYSRHLKYLAFFGGLIFALGVGTKFVAILLAPAFLIALSQLGSERGKLLLRSVIGGVVALISCMLIIDGLDVEQLFGTHSVIREKQKLPGFPYLIDLMKLDLDMLGLSFAGVLLAAHKGEKSYYVPLAWFLVVVVALSFHSPIWTHHYLYYSVPLCWLAGLGFGQVLRLEKSNIFPGVLVVCFCIIVLLNIPNKFTRIRDALPQIGTSVDEGIVEILKQGSGWLVTDEPLYAVLAERLVPPEIAVSTVKRKIAGQITDERFMDAVENHTPDQVLLGRFKSTKKSLPEKLLAKGYHLRHQDNRFLLFELKSK